MSSTTGGRNKKWSKVKTEPSSFRTGPSLQLLELLEWGHINHSNKSSRGRWRRSHQFLSVHESCLEFESWTKDSQVGWRSLHRTTNNHRQPPQPSCQKHSKEHSILSSTMGYHLSSYRDHYSTPWACWRVIKWDWQNFAVAGIALRNSVSYLLHPILFSSLKSRDLKFFDRLVAREQNVGSLPRGAGTRDEPLITSGFSFEIPRK